MTSKEEVYKIIEEKDFCTLINGAGQKFYVEEYHEYNAMIDAHEANDDNGNTVYIKLRELDILPEA
jgi:hypothetical protein